MLNKIVIDFLNYGLASSWNALLLFYNRPTDINRYS